MRALAAAGVILVLAAAPALADCYAWPVIRVYDGDSLTVTLPELPPELREVGVRVINIDAPEIKGKCEAERSLAIAARDALAAMVTSGPVEICPIGPVAWDKYGRILATVWVGTGTTAVDVGEELVRRGLARPYNGGERSDWCW